MRRLFLGLAGALLVACGARAEDATHAITNPDWTRKPDTDDLQRFWPGGSLGLSGKARIRCIVTSRGTLDACKIVSEEPAGGGFGAAALLMAPLFAMKPMTVDGRPLGGAEVFIPINFNGGGTPFSGDQVRVANNLPWAIVPTAEDLATAFPAEAVGRAAAGRVVLRCRLTDLGGLKLCQIASEEPRGHGFAKAARDLAQMFRVADELRGSKELHGVYVDVPFDFHDPHLPSPPMEVNDPEWLQGVDPATAGSLFPALAAKAGLKTGRAIVGCVVAHDGSLTGCAVSSEEPAGMGFGASALVIAGMMKMNA
jgi:TonB family protein